MAAIDLILGALVIGAWINCSLYALELVCFWFYFQRPKRDHMLLVGVLLVMLAVDTVNTILQCVTVYKLSVTAFGDLEALAKGTVFFALQCALPSTTAFITQLFLVWRFFKISNNYAVSAFLCLAPLGAYISALYATVALLVYTSLQDRLRVVQIGTAWLTMEAAADILIAVALVLLLGKYTRQTTFADTQSLLKKLMLKAIQTGSITASLAVAMLLAFLFSKTTNLNTGFSYVLGRLYALTLMMNLLVRPGSESGIGNTTVSQSGGGSNSAAGQERTPRHGAGTFKLGGSRSPAPNPNAIPSNVNVAHEVTVHIDQARDEDQSDIIDEKQDFGSERFEMANLTAVSSADETLRKQYNAV